METLGCRPVGSCSRECWIVEREMVTIVSSICLSGKRVRRE